MESTTPRDTEARRLDGRAVRLWRAALAVRTAGGVALVLASDALFWDGGLAVILAAVAAIAGGIAVVVWPPAQYRAWRYEIRERDVRLRHGVLWRTVSVVPHARIQHVDTRRGPLERWIGLARVVIYTAGTRGAEITIPALAAGEAEALRDRLASLSGSEDAV